jgi:hypothetical protein
MGVLASIRFALEGSVSKPYCVDPCVLFGAGASWHGAAERFDVRASSAVRWMQRVMRHRSVELVFGNSSVNRALVSHEIRREFVLDQYILPAFHFSKVNRRFLYEPRNRC